MAKEFAKKFYDSIEWQNVREAVLMRDKYLCVKCGNPAEEVHHIIHLNQSNINDIKISLNADNLISLCRNCHFKEHELDKKRGLKNKQASSDCDEGFEFDENGYLIVKDTPPV